MTSDLALPIETDLVLDWPTSLGFYTQVLHQMVEVQHVTIKSTRAFSSEHRTSPSSVFFTQPHTTFSFGEDILNGKLPSGSPEATKSRLSARSTSHSVSTREEGPLRAVATGIQIDIAFL